MNHSMPLGLSHKAEDLNKVVALGAEGEEGVDEIKGPLSSHPGVASYELSQDDEFLVLASDGLFDSISNQMVVNFVRRNLYLHGDTAKAADDLIKKAFSDCGSVDNTTCIIISLKSRT